MWARVYQSFRQMISLIIYNYLQLFIYFESILYVPFNNNILNHVEEMSPIHY